MESVLWMLPVTVARRRPCRAITEAARHGIRASSTRPIADGRRDRRGETQRRRLRADGRRLRALIVLLWRAGLRISEALSLQESDLDNARRAMLVRRGKGGKRREVGMDRWVWERLDPWLELRRQLPIDALLCVIHGPTRDDGGRRPTRKQLHHAAAGVGIRRRFAPHQLRHAQAVEMAHVGVPLVVIQRQLGHANLGITSMYLQGIDSSEIISTVHGPPSPTISATAGLRMTR